MFALFPAPIAMRFYKIHALCLDAPLVAVLGMLAVHDAVGHSLMPGRAIIVFLTVWLAYVGDRWMDARRNSLGALHSPRHCLFVANPERWLRVWLGMFLTNLLLSIWVLSWAEWFYGLLIGAGSITYTIMSQKRAWKGVRKELAVGLMFGWVAGGFKPWELSWSGYLMMLSIGSLCALNSLWVSRNDWSLDELRAEFSAFRRRGDTSPESLARRIWIALSFGSIVSALWVSVPFAIIGAAYVGGMFWISGKSSFSSEYIFSAVADGALVLALILGLIVL